MVAYKKSNRKSFKKSSNKSKRVYKRKPSLKLKSYVKKILHRQIENKLVTSGSTFNLYPISNSNFTMNNIFPLSPHTEAGYPAAMQIIISQGSGSGNRVGDRIRTAKVMLKGIIYPNPHNSVSNTLNAPLEIIMWIFKIKGGLQDTQAAVSNMMANNIFKIGNAASPISNTLSDLNMPINNDVIIVKKKRVFKVGNSSQAVSVGSNSSNLYSNNDFKLNNRFSIDVTKYVNKNIRFADANNNATTSTTWCAFTFSAADNSAVLPSLMPASVNYWLTYQYEDA